MVKRIIIRSMGLFLTSLIGFDQCYGLRLCCWSYCWLFWFFEILKVFDQIYRHSEKNLYTPCVRLHFLAILKMAAMDLRDSNDLLNSIEHSWVEGQLDLYRPKWTWRQEWYYCCCYKSSVVAAVVGFGAEEDQPRHTFIASPPDPVCCMESTDGSAGVCVRLRSSSARPRGSPPRRTMPHAPWGGGVVARTARPCPSLPVSSSDRRK